jgi:phage shock protein C
MVRPAPVRDAGAMNTENRMLTRSSTDRKIGGVAGGLGAYFGVDPILFRVGFVVAALLSGAGAVAYLALLAFVPCDDAAEPRVAMPA